MVVSRYSWLMLSKAPLNICVKYPFLSPVRTGESKYLLNRVMAILVLVGIRNCILQIVPPNSVQAHS